MTNSLYYGGDMEKIHEEMLSMAKEMLSTDHLQNHPDFLEISLPEKKSSIGVEEILPIVTLSTRRPILATGKSIAIINGMDFCTLAAQNKLLLTLEANKNVLILASVKNMALVLDTVKSRMRKICLSKESLETYEKLFGEDAALIYTASGGDISLANRCKEHISSLKRLKKSCESGLLSDLLPILHLVKEKDPESFALDKSLMELSFSVIADTLSKKAIAEYSAGNEEEALLFSKKTQLASKEIGTVNNNNYTKDNFFLAIVQIIES